MSRASRPLLVIASLLAVAGCVTTPPEPSSGREAASDVLSRAIGDGTQLVGFTIGADVLLLEGRDTRQRRLFPVEQKSGEAISSTQSGPWVLGRDFDLPASLARADEQLDRCEGGGRVSVRVLSPEATLTTTDCGDDSHVLLNDTDLPALDSSISEALKDLVTELDSAGLASSVTAIEFDRTADAVRISFTGDDPTREYTWLRGWGSVDSILTSRDVPPGGSVTIEAAVLLNAPDDLAEELADSADAERVLLLAGDEGRAVEVQVS